MRRASLVRKVRWDHRVLKVLQEKLVCPVFLVQMVYQDIPEMKVQQEVKVQW